MFTYGKTWQQQIRASQGFFVANFNSICEGNVRVIQFADTQITDESYCHLVGRKITEIANSMNETALLLNLKTVQYMTSAMIGKLVQLRNHCKKKGIKFAVCALDEHVLESIQLMRIDTILTIHESQQEALTAMQS